MIVTKEQLSERYSSMLDMELLSLCPENLTQEAQEVYEKELNKRNINKEKQEKIKEDIKIKQDNIKENIKEIKKKDNRILGKIIKILAGIVVLSVGKSMAHGYIIEGVITLGSVCIVLWIFRKFL